MEGPNACKGPPLDECANSLYHINGADGTDENSATDDSASCFDSEPWVCMKGPMRAYTAS